MLTAEQIGVLRDSAEKLLDPITEYLLDDIAKRVAAAGQFTGTASYQVWRLQELGLSQRQIKKEVAKRLKISLKDTEKLLTQVAKTGYNFDMSRFPTKHGIPFSANSSLQQILQATVQLAKEDLTNITQTIGFVGPDGKCRKLTDAYNQACDFAFQKASTGAQDYWSAIREATKNLADQGIRVIDYESGVHTSLEAAVRRNIMGGAGLMQEQISQLNHDTMGCDGWEISAHAASAPDHEPYQGKQYTDAEYYSLNNSLVRRIGTLNCGHSASPIILGVNDPQYTAEELEQFRKENEEGIMIGGKHYTLYEATQRQRKYERKIRKQRHKILVAEGLNDKDQLQTAQIKMVRLQEEYVRFSKDAKLPLQHARMEVASFNWKHAKAAEKTASQIEQERTAKEVKLVSTKASAATPVTPNPARLSGKGYVDITGSWYPEAVPNSHPVRDLQEYVVDGVTYKVDGRNVQLNYKSYEKEIAELLEREVGGEIFMVPRVNNPQGVKTPDFLFHGRGYDLKTIGKTTGKNPIFNRIQNARGQAKNFILDLTDAGLDEDFIQKQLARVFSDGGTEFVDEVVVIRNGKIEKVLKRQKKS